MRDDLKSMNDLIEEAQRAVLKRIIVLAPQSQHGESARNLAEAYACLRGKEPGKVGVG
jgi:hypothetical protein